MERSGRLGSARLGQRESGGARSSERCVGVCVVWSGGQAESFAESEAESSSKSEARYKRQVETSGRYIKVRCLKIYEA